MLVLAYVVLMQGYSSYVTTAQKTSHVSKVNKSRRHKFPKLRIETIEEFDMQKYPLLHIINNIFQSNQLNEGFVITIGNESTFGRCS